MAKVKLAKVRLSMFNDSLFEAREFEKGDGKFRYSANFLIEKGDANHKAVEAAIKEAAEDKFGKKAAATVESLRGNNNKFCYRDGDKTTMEDYAGMMVLASHRQQKAGAPHVYSHKKHEGKLCNVDQAGNAYQPNENGKLEKVDPDFEVKAPYSGCYVNATVEIYAQDGTNSGIRCGLVAVQFHSDGDSFGGVSKGNPDDFGEIESGADAEDLS